MLRGPCYTSQDILEEISRLESQQKGNDEMRRQIDEVIAYQQSRAIEKELQLKIEQVDLSLQELDLLTYSIQLYKC